MNRVRALAIRRAFLAAALSIGTLSFSASLASGQRAGTPAAPAKPALVVFITIDQMRADYFERFGRQLSGGLKRLHDGGAFFLKGFQDHAITETAPGHASTMSGRFPVHTGIVMNSQGVNGVPDAAVFGGRPNESASPARFQGTTLLDWMKAADSKTRFLSVSRKDRGAILPIGKSKGDVFWWGTDGGFTTSRYYTDALPTWVQQFNARKVAESYAGKLWTPLKDASWYPEPDSVGIEALSNGYDSAFPHATPSDPAQMARVFPNYPWMDEATLALALQGVRTLGLGDSPARTDLLAVSLSTLDAVGHRYGPDSKEVHDQILRLDQYLGAFLDSLEAIRGSGHLLVALTGDHGMSPFPWLKSTIYPNGDAKRVNLDLPWRAFLQRLEQAGVDTGAVAMEESMVVVTKPEVFKAARVNVDSALQSFGADAMRVQGVLRVDLMSSLVKADTVRDAIARRWLHMVRPDWAARMFVTLTPYSYWSTTTYATHGSPHDSDANVPVLFWGPWVRAGQFSETVRVVDMAPTLAALLGVNPLEPLDGRVLTQVRP